MKRNVDVWIYAGIVALLVFYAIYIKQTCEELGCLAVIIPIIGIGIVSVIEFIICIFAVTKGKIISGLRYTALVISGFISLIFVTGIISQWLS